MSKMIFFILSVLFQIHPQPTANPEMQTQQPTLQKLKNLLQKDDTQQGFIQFSNLLSSDPHPQKIDMNILLRWSIHNQKQHFHSYYSLLTSKYGANVNFADTRQKKTNLMIACQHKREDIVEILAGDKKINFLIEDGCNKNVLFYAINNKNKAAGEKYVRILLKKCPELIKNDSKRNNPLIQAIKLNRVQIARVLLEEGANPNDPIDNNGNTVLHQAFRLMKNSKPKLTSSAIQIFQLLIEKGGNPYLKNLQNKDAFDVTDKQAQQFKKIYNEIKEKEKERNTEAIGANAKPVLVINDIEQREKMYSEAEDVYEKYKGLIEMKKKEVLAAFDKDEKGFDEDPFEPHHNFVNQLTKDIENFANQCINDYRNAEKDLQDFIAYLTPITKELGFGIKIYGSYATGLWINHCDIDILLIPEREQATQRTVEQYLDWIALRLKNSPYQKLTILRNLKIPLMRIQVGQDSGYRKSRKLDISILTPNNNGLQHVGYVLQFIGMYPQIKPLFFIIKKLTHCYRLYDPLKSGVRSFALFLMLVIFMQEPHQQNLGGLLLKFLSKYGYNYDYECEDSGHKMVLNLPDPFNAKNNIGNNTDAFCLQRMFKTAYLILHTRDAQTRLEYLFQSREMFPINIANG